MLRGAGRRRAPGHLAPRCRGRPVPATGLSLPLGLRPEQDGAKRLALLGGHPACKIDCASIRILPLSCGRWAKLWPAQPLQPVSLSSRYHLRGTRYHR
jgi:hypothetical protein